MNHTSTARTFNPGPSSLDSIVREHRDEIQLRLSNIKEIDALVKAMYIPLSIKDEIDNWRLISLIDKPNGIANIFVVGDSRKEHQPRVTSSIVALDFEKHLAFTKNHSVYALGNRGLGEPPKGDLLCISAAMCTWFAPMQA